ncbi:hypothetical protein NKJ40_31110 [Mesorhizobium sp. M0119]|uniref:hypothetical protein n=1 Tax=Mesorhizobium sp. M0119 TaxID=2956885 RepID=UPI00333D3E3B
MSAPDHAPHSSYKILLALTGASTQVHDDGGHITVMFADGITGMSSKVKGYVSDPFGGAAKATQRCWFES